MLVVGSICKWGGGDAAKLYDQSIARSSLSHGANYAVPGDSIWLPGGAVISKKF